MKLVKISMAALAGLGCMAGPSLAQRVAQPPTYRGHLEGFDRNATALPRIVEAAQRDGARVLEVRYNGRHGRRRWDLALEQGRRVAFVEMSSPDAKAVVVHSSSEPVWMLGWRGRKEVEVVRHAQVGLAQAVRAAEIHDGGAPAVAAGIAVSASDPNVTIPAYNVLLLEPDDHLRRFEVDARTGLVIAQPRGLAGWPA